MLIFVRVLMLIEPLHPGRKMLGFVEGVSEDAVGARNAKRTGHRKRDGREDAPP